MGYKHPEYFADWANSNEKNVTDMINCNIISLTKMSAIVLPGMVKRKGGIIINNASGSGRIPTPLLSVYSASKSYVDFFSRYHNINEYKNMLLVNYYFNYLI
jgi:17beta-estradiol 17-dehydrogenase / very-long-chain 3-oxoacyl-CoA reductase